MKKTWLGLPRNAETLSVLLYPETWAEVIELLLARVRLLPHMLDLPGAIPALPGAA